MSKETFLYKIRDVNTGLFSTGGMDPNWTTKGKTWTGLGPLKSHLRQFVTYEQLKNGQTDYHTQINKIPENWEVVKIKFIESEVELLNAKQLYPKEIKS